MTNCKDLPVEILEKVFQSLDKDDISQCSLTCSAWNVAAQPILFQNINVLTDSKLRDLSTILSCSSLHQSPGNFVKNVHVYHVSVMSDVVLIDEMFPFLEVIDISNNLQIYDELYQLMMEGRFSNLKKSPFTKLDKAHLNLLMARKEHVNDIELRDELHGENAINQLSENMHLLSKLRKVKLRLSQETSKLCLETLFSKNFPVLKTITFVFVPPAKLTLDIPLDLDAIQPLSSVQEVQMYNHYLFCHGGESYLYFMKKFPNVQTLYLNSVVQEHRNQVPTVACLSEFLLYLFKIKEICTVRYIISNHITAKVVENFLYQALDQNSGAKIQLQIAFEAIIPQQEPDGNPNCTAYIDAYRNHRSSKETFELKVVFKLIEPDFISQPYLKLFQRVGSMDIEKLMIGDNSWMRLTPSELPVPLDVTLSHFTNLKKLCIHKISNITFPSLEIKSASPLEHLTFERCNLNPNIFRNISKTCLNLRVLEIDTSCHFTNHDEDQDAEDTLRILSIYMPFTRLRDLSLFVLLDASDYHDDQYERAFIRLKTANKKIRYCSLIWAPIYWGQEPFYSTEFDTDGGSYTEDDFETCLKDSSCIVYDIYCEAVKKLTVNAGKMDTYIEQDKTKVFLEEDL